MERMSQSLRQETIGRDKGSPPEDLTKDLEKDYFLPQFSRNSTLRESSPPLNNMPEIMVFPSSILSSLKYILDKN